MKTIYSIVVKAVETHLNLENKKVSDLDKFSLRKKIDASDKINYDNFANTFAKLFWSRNYWKAVYFFEYEYYLAFSAGKNELDVLVLGAGSASDTIAFLTWLNCKKQHYQVNLILVDRSMKQLAMSRHLINLIKSKLKNIKFKVNYRQQKLGILNFTSSSFDIILMSHFLTENKNALYKILFESRRLLRSKGDLIIIERNRDPIWKNAINLLPEMGISFYETNLIHNKILNEQNNFDRSITPHYVRGSYPEQEYQADLVYKYFNAWRQQSVCVIKQIFTEDAQYDEKPGIEEKIFGLRGIVNYWEENPLRQKNINVHVRNIGFGPNNIVCAYEGDFDTPKQHIVIKGAINFGVDHYSHKISQLTQYFGTQKTPFK